MLFFLRVKYKMVLKEEFETAKNYIAQLDADINQYTRDISLPIKERIYAEWGYLKNLCAKIEEELFPKKVEKVEEPPKVEAPK